MPNFSAYSSSKSAIIRFTETLAEELKPHNICVNAIAPGSISTKMTEEIHAAGSAAGQKENERTGKVLKGGGVPLSIPASLAVFLASDASNGLTGKVISAVHDNWKEFGQMASELNSSDMYVMRRISPDTLERLKTAKIEKGSVK
jgi:3-oxoacyl-[acyl-carrier protein] reductase